MKRKTFLKLIPAAGITPLIMSFTGNRGNTSVAVNGETANSRAYWINVMEKIAGPVLQHLSAGKLKLKMPVETSGKDRDKVTYLEAFGRALAGIAPWLELGHAGTTEGRLRADYIKMVHRCIAAAVDPASPDYMNFNEGGQPLVDAAFFAHGLVRGYEQLWKPLDDKVKNKVVEALKKTRTIRPGESNWLLFSAMVEAFLLKSGYAWESTPVNYALSRHAEWYVGDGTYGDGPEYHWDYYNSFVIQPMLIDVVRIMSEKGMEVPVSYGKIVARARRYAAIQERLISPEGTYPPIGRSLCYRFGAFQLLAQVALMRQLPAEVSPAQVRSALSAVIAKQVEAPGVFDSNGWLTIGVTGHQPGTGETYISTGSLYLCTTGLLPLGLPQDDPFWAEPPADWTSRKIWNGIDLPVDHAYKE